MIRLPLCLLAPLILLATIAVGVGLALLPQVGVLPAALLIAALLAWARPRCFCSPLSIVTACAFVLAAGPAMAATGTDILDSLRPLLVDIATIVIAAAVAFAAQRFQSWTGIQVEARHREALQSALANGARVAIEGGSVADITRAVAYVQKSVPDALAHFQVKDADRIAELLKPHLLTARTPA